MILVVLIPAIRRPAAAFRWSLNNISYCLCRLFPPSLSSLEGPGVGVGVVLRSDIRLLFGLDGVLRGEDLLLDVFGVHIVLRGEDLLEEFGVYEAFKPEGPAWTVVVGGDDVGVGEIPTPTGIWAVSLNMLRYILFPSLPRPLIYMKRSS